MYRALYAHNSKLPKYLSFEAGDRFTLVDTSKSDQWFLAQNGLGEIGFVPFNYIKKIEATNEQLVKFIDGAMEAIHLQATNSGGQYTHEQRVIMKKLVKHRSEVIKNASASESKSAHRRRPAPAPPVDRSSSLDATAAGKNFSLAVVGRRATVTAASTSCESKKAMSDIAKDDGKHAKDDGKHKKKSCLRQDEVSSREGKTTSSSDPRRSSALSETTRTEVISEDCFRKSKSVTSSIGQAPSLVSSFSSNTSDLTCTDSTADASKLSDEGIEETLSTDSGEINQHKAPQNESNCTAKLETHFDVSDTNIRMSAGSENGDRNEELECLSSEAESSTQLQIAVVNSVDQGDMPPPPAEYSNHDDSRESTTSSISGLNEPDLPSEDLPPPPPEVYADIDDDHFEVDDTLPPAPPDFGEELKVDDFYVNLHSDIQELCGKKPMEECTCEDFQPKFESAGKFFAHNSLQLPPPHNVKLSKKEIHQPKQVSHVFSSLLKPQDDPEKVVKQHELLELAQAHCVQVTHADCEEVIGEFRKVTGLSHEESHWAILTVMNLLATKVPHIKPSLEVVGMRFNMAHECNSTGLDYLCEDTLTLHRLISELEAVTFDSQQRGHYLRDDLDSIIDIITGLSETLNNAKLCVSMAAIQRDNFNMVEIIAKYYQMETRWVIHSCMLHLIEIICRLNPMAIQEFLYSELPQEMVAEMQQHQNDDARFLQVAKTLGIIFMKGLSSPHKLVLTMDIPFFIWLLGMTENMAEMNRPSDVDMLLALICAYHLQHEDNSQNPVTEALKMAHGHALLESALIFLSKHDDPTKLLESSIEPKLNSIVLLLSHLFDNPDTADLLYTNDVEALIGIFEEFLRDLTRDDPLRSQILHLFENFMRNYPDTVSMKGSLNKRLGPLLLNIREEKSKCGEMAAQILDDNSVIFDEV